jgi:hypothetical protein
VTVSDRGVCARCGAILARDHAGEALCSPCAATAPVERLRILEPEELAFAVGGILLLYRGLQPGKRVPVRQVLAQLRVSAEPWEIHQSVEKWRARGLVIDARARRCGYRVVDVLVPFVRPFHRRCSSDPDQTSLALTPWSTRQPVEEPLAPCTARIAQGYASTESYAGFILVASLTEPRAG